MQTDLRDSAKICTVLICLCKTLLVMEVNLMKSCYIRLEFEFLCVCVPGALKWELLVNLCVAGWELEGEYGRWHWNSLLNLQVSHGKRSRFEG